MSSCIEAPNESIARHRLRKLMGYSRGKLKCHTCDNPLCYNTEHIYWGNHSTNAIDKVMRRGGNKLTLGQVGVIRYLRKRGYTLEVIGQVFDISPPMVSRICLGKAWNHGEA